MRQPATDLMYAPFFCSYENPYDEIYNILSQVGNALIAGWECFFEAERLRQELAELKGRPVEEVECTVMDTPRPPARIMGANIVPGHLSGWPFFVSEVHHK